MAGPVRRFMGTLGLVVLGPTAWMMTTGSISPGDAAVRAAATLGLTLLLGRFLTRVLVSMAVADRRRPAPPANRGMSA